MPFFKSLHRPECRVGFRTIPEHWWYAGNLQLLDNHSLIYCWARPNHLPAAEQIATGVIQTLADSGGVLLVTAHARFYRFLIQTAVQLGVPFVVIEPRMASLSAGDLENYKKLIKNHDGLIITATTSSTHPVNVPPESYYSFAAFLAQRTIILPSTSTYGHRDLELFAEKTQRQILIPALPAGISSEQCSLYLRQLRYYRDIEGTELIGLKRLRKHLLAL